MNDDVSRRDWIRTMGAFGAGTLVRPAAAAAASTVPLNEPVSHRNGEIMKLLSTSEVFIPPRGRSFMKFSFDFPEPAVALGNHRFSFLVFTEENTYGMDQTGMKVSGDVHSLILSADGFTWAGGQEKGPGRLTATFAQIGSSIEWDVVAESDRPIKSVTTVIRDAAIQTGPDRDYDPTAGRSSIQAGA